MGALPVARVARTSDAARSYSGTVPVDRTTTECAATECFERAFHGLTSGGSTAPVLVSNRTRQLSPNAFGGITKLIGSLWAIVMICGAYRDALGVSNPEERPDYQRFHEKVPHPKGETTFLALRPWYQAPAARTFRYHRFWAQVEVAVANAEVARLD